MIQFEGLIAILLAPLLGSFLGVVIDRLPHGLPVISGRSRCDHCEHQLGPRELIPLFSYLLQRGRCRHCDQPLGLFYPIIELAAVAVAFSAALALEGWLLWVSLGLGFGLLVLAVIDHRHFFLPDVITLPLILAGLLVTYLIKPETILAHLLGAVLGFLVFAGITWLYRHFRHRDGLGLGDAKLLAAAGAWLGWEALPGVVLISTITALTVALIGAGSGARLNATSKLAFGPYLAIALWASWLLGPLILA